ncbi:hypothetical protein CLV78_1011039 [Aliiruegeria haliotis]|uniref:Uncharacterized protein n=1 Tax=Aliiruegeria haliotis TaxID=1280846 RepID=A0A2T0S0I2_9RHOB|nr:hypothetical protein CLV78_1011039 [Aliiruegeria haliotis]
MLQGRMSKVRTNRSLASGWPTGAFCPEPTFIVSRSNSRLQPLLIDWQENELDAKTELVLLPNLGRPTKGL